MRVWHGPSIAAASYASTNNSFSSSSSSSTAGGGGGGGFKGKGGVASSSSSASYNTPIVSSSPLGGGRDAAPHSPAAQRSTLLPSTAGGGGIDSSSNSVDGRPPLVASFVALPEIAAFDLARTHATTTAAAMAGAGAIGGGYTGEGTSAVPGLVMTYMPSTGVLAVGGGRAPLLRLWDLGAERCTAAISLDTPHPSATTTSSSVVAGAIGGGSGCFVTSLSSAWPGTPILVLGTSMGAIHVVDTRLASSPSSSLGGGGSRGGRRSPIVSTLSEHRAWVVNVGQARSGSVYALVSGSLTADVRFWDLRRPGASVHSIQAHRGPLTCISGHDYAPLLATGTRNKQV